MGKNVLTIATGKKLYVDLAINLARSFLLWHPNTGIRFHLVTDHPEFIPPDVKNRITVREIAEGELGTGFSTKLHLDKLAPEGQTLFIDSDCLVFGSLEEVFEKFKGHSVSVIGNYIAKEEWFGDIEAICGQFNIKQIPKFNGGIYYLEKGEAAAKVYETARLLEPEYDVIGFKRLRNRPNDEVLMAVAMELNHQCAIPEDGSVMGEFVNFQSGFKANIFSGKAVLFNCPNHIKYQANWPITVATPLVVHFLGDYTNYFHYRLFKKQLRLYFEQGYNKHLIQFLTFFSVFIPYFLSENFKNIFRPLYRFIFGFRELKASERMIN